MAWRLCKLCDRMSYLNRTHEEPPIIASEYVCVACLQKMPVEQADAAIDRMFGCKSAKQAGRSQRDERSRHTVLRSVQEEPVRDRPVYETRVQPEGDANQEAARTATERGVAVLQGDRECEAGGADG